MPFTEAQTALLRNYVSNLDRSVYVIQNLPEEVIAVIFAYVSRSPRSFRANLLKLVEDQDIDLAGLDRPAYDYAHATEKAQKFHERWVVGYGHSSVAEHAVVHIGVERISRLASAELELSNPFLSFTEYSQRYQKPQRGDWFVPDDLPAELAGAFDAFCQRAYDAYEALETGLIAHLQSEVTQTEGESDKRYQSRIAKIAFEDARYVLPLAMHTSLGLTANGRALRDAVVRLATRPWPEAHRLAADLRREATTVLPTLLKYAEPSETRLQVEEAMRAEAGMAAKAAPPTPGSAVELLSCPNEAEALALLDAAVREAFAPAANMPPGGDSARWQTWLAALGPHDPAPEACRAVRYQFRLSISEGNWHQFLRHSRRVRFSWDMPSVAGGLTIPPRIAAAGLRERVAAIASEAAELHRRLADTGFPRAADYVVLNAHHRGVIAELDLQELHHLLNLRGKADAQWDVRRMVKEMGRLARRVHPHLIGERLLHLDEDGADAPQASAPVSA